MSENATRKSDGQRVKIGTCEAMYYLRFSQRGDVDYPWPALSDDTDKLDPFLYRFPDPREDRTLPGEYESGWGGIKLSMPTFWAGFEPGAVDHGSIQAHAQDGYMFNLPCPEGNPSMYVTKYDGTKPHRFRNGGTTTVTITAQRWYGGHLALVVNCAACRHSIRLPELSDALPILEELQRLGAAAIREAECYYGGRDTDPLELEQIRGNMAKRADYWNEVAARIIAGYNHK